MAKAFTAWTVLKHGPLEKLAENLWRLEGIMPNGSTRRVMSLVRLSDGRVLIHNAIALEEDLMKEIGAWGTPAAILVPNAFHRQDSKIMKDRFPSAKVYCPAGAKKKVSDVVAVDGTFADAPQDATVVVRHLEGVKAKEGVLEVTSTDGRTLVFCDTVLNLEAEKVPLLFRPILGPLGRVSVPRFARWFFASDKGALRADLEKMAAKDGLVRLIPGHGHVVTADAPNALRGAAQTIG